MRYMIVCWQDGEKCKAILLKDNSGDVALFPDVDSAVAFADFDGCANFKLIDTFE